MKHAMKQGLKEAKPFSAYFSKDFIHNSGHKMFDKKPKNFRHVNPLELLKKDDHFFDKANIDKDINYELLGFQQVDKDKIHKLRENE